MSNTHRAAFGIAAAVSLFAGVAPHAQAETVRITIHGSVEYNQVTSGVFAGVHANDPVTIAFDIDSTQFSDSTNFPTRLPHRAKLVRAQRRRRAQRAAIAQRLSDVLRHPRQ